MKRVSIFLITVALIAGMVGCAPTAAQYNLTISSTEGGEVVTPGEGALTYDEGEVIDLVAEPEDGYRFVNWTGDVSTIADINAASTTITMNGDYSIMASFVAVHRLTVSSTAGGAVTVPGEGAFTYDKGTLIALVAQPDEGYQFVNWTGDVDSIADVNSASTTITMNGDYTISANFGIGIYDWYDLDAIRGNPGGSYILMRDLDSTTLGYTELAGPTADGGKGWEPIGSLVADPITHHVIEPVAPFGGSFDGQGYEIRNLFINRPDDDGVGLFGCVGEGVIENPGVVNAEVTGRDYVGGLVGHNDGIVSDSYFTGSVTGRFCVGGLAGTNGNTVSDSYFTGSVTGDNNVGGLVGLHGGVAVSNSYYNYNEVRINRQNIITIGALFGEDFEQWLANDKFLDVNQRLSQEDGYYLINDVSDFKQLLAFGQDESLKFRLKDDLDLTNEPNFYIPYLAGEFDGNGHKISNLSLSFNFGFVSHLGLFGYVASGGQVTRVGVEDVKNTTYKGDHVGGLVGCNDGTVSNSYLTGRVTGTWAVGGLVGANHGTVSNSYSTADVTGDQYAGGLVGTNSGSVGNSYSIGSVTGDDSVGGLVGDSYDGTVSNSLWDIQTSGQATSGGGTGKTTAEMQDIATFAGWSIIAVAHGVTNPAYTWNIIEGQTYPFLSWQSVS